MVKGSIFKFKQFAIQQDICAMKVGTDAIILGAWADLNHATKVLDLGTGTGILALMSAQRLAQQGRLFKIYALDKDQNACAQAEENFKASPWADSFQLWHGDLAEVLPMAVERFDHILMNPPYFTQALKCENPSRKLARHQEYGLDLWLKLAMGKLNPQGQLSMILPFDIGMALMAKIHYCCVRHCRVITKLGKSPKRILLSFSKQKNPIRPKNFEKNYQIARNLIIFDQDNKYTDEFRHLTQDFYWNF